MREKAQRALRRNARILLPQRSGGCVARIGELTRLLASHSRFVSEALVERGEIGLCHVHLATHLEEARCACGQSCRDVGDGAHVRRDVFAGCAIAAGQRLHELSLLVAQGAGEPVDLRLGGECDLFVVGEPQEASDPRDKLGYLFVREGIVQAGHRPGMRNLGEMAAGRGTNLPGWCIAADQVRECCLNRVVAAHQGVIVRVRYFRGIVGMIKAIVARDLGGKLFQFGGGGLVVVRNRDHAREVSQEDRHAKPMQKGRSDAPAFHMQYVQKNQRVPGTSGSIALTASSSCTSTRPRPRCDAR